jgi:hypothetical protein
MLSGIGILITLLGVIGAAWKAPIDGIVARQERDLQILEGSTMPVGIREPEVADAAGARRR